MSSTTKMLRSTVGIARSTARLYSTRPPPSAASQAHPYLSQIDSSSTSSSSTSPHVGPFPLPSTPSDRDRMINQQAQQWSKLRPGEKIGVAAKQTSSFFVVVAGAGLCSLVVWAITTELFSDNSPTRIFEDTVERVKADQELNTILMPPLTFYGSPSNAVSSRMRRNRRIAHTHTTDPQTGVETLFIRFYVQAREERSEGESGEWWEEGMDWLKRWVGPLVWQDSHHPENYHPKLSSEERAREQEREEAIERKRREEELRRNGGWTRWIGDSITGVFVGAFGGVTRGVRDAQGVEGERSPSGGLFKRTRKPKLGEFSEGEVVAELQKDPQSNQFVYKQLFVAIPDTSYPNYYRHDIPTEVIVNGAERRGVDRLRFWNRSKTVVA